MLQVLWPSGFIGLEVKWNGASLASNITALDFIGPGVSVVINGTTAEVTIPGGGGGGLTVQDTAGNQVLGVNTITVALPGLVSPGVPGEAFIACGARWEDTFGNVTTDVWKVSVQGPAAAVTGAPGEVLVFPFNAPATPADDDRAVYASGGDLAYSAALKFETPARIPTFTGVGNFPRFDNSLGYTVFRFNPDTAPAGAPWFGSGNGFLWKAQDAALASGLAGGDMGMQAGDGSGGGGTGGTAFLQAGGNPGSPSDRGVAEMRVAGGAAAIRVGGANGLALSFYGGVPETQPTVTGSRGGNAALASLLTELATLGLIVDGTTP